MSTDSRLPRDEYPVCPRCGGPVAGAMMTSQSVDLGTKFRYETKMIAMDAPRTEPAPEGEK